MGGAKKLEDEREHLETFVCRDGFKDLAGLQHLSNILDSWILLAFSSLLVLSAQETCSSFTLAQKRVWSSAASRRATGKE